MINYKLLTLTLLILFPIVIGLIIRTPTNIKTFEFEVSELKLINDSLLTNNHKLKLINDSINKEIDSLNILLVDNIEELTNKDSLINNLKDEKSEIPSRVDDLDATGVAKSLSEYFERR